MDHKKPSPLQSLAYEVSFAGDDLLQLLLREPPSDSRQTAFQYIDELRRTLDQLEELLESE